MSTPTCSRCSESVPVGSRFCPACGAAVDGSEARGRETPVDATIESSQDGTGSPRPSSGSLSSSSDSLDGGAFPPGTVLSERYRVVGLLGKGGMGEVYRADDLKLAQSVALKFLPVEIAASPDRLQRFYSEVRVARQVAHPNVCRVYDIEEIEGRPFLTMEYIDGEDLSSLLRRIGRLPEEKALEIATQLCLGLAALHERGVLHRDLKPANVMIDGRGRVRITDFGLAGLAAEVARGDFRAGTPAYMAPEQLAGKSVSARSDLYALGLILYEVFTGRRTFAADTLAEITRLQREATPASPSTIISNFDPAVERAILRCLEKDPAQRPASAIEVVAALPGGDPLAAALAAGETPSPEMVAAAGEKGGVRMGVGLLCVAAVAVGLFLHVRTLSREAGYNYVSLEKPPAVLADHARGILERVGYEQPPRDTAYGYGWDQELVDRLGAADSSATRWDILRTERPPSLWFWYRESPDHLGPRRASGRVRPDDPAPVISGMASVKMDTRGRLVFLMAIPPERDESPPAEAPSEVDWASLFADAGLDIATFAAAAPQWTGLGYADSRRAWTGPNPDDPDAELRVEAASYRGRPVSFAVITPWTRPERMVLADSGEGPGAAKMIGVPIVLLVLGAGIFLAHRNLRLGRGDRKGALRFGLFVWTIMMLSWLLTASHVPDVGGEFSLLFRMVANALLAATLYAAFYLALEPYVRRLWPDRIISWSRVLRGGFRDPLVGRDILIGGALFFVVKGFELLFTHAYARLGLPPGDPDLFDWDTLLGARHWMAVALDTLQNAVFQPLFWFVLLVMLRAVFRRVWIAFAVLVGIITVLAGLESPHLLLGMAEGLLLSVGMLYVLTRFGLLPFMVAEFFSSMATHFPLTLDASRWYFGGSLFALIVLLGLAVYGLATATAGQSLFRDELG